MPFFICPNCGHREVSAERTAGFSARPKGCSKCGFGFVFELLDDYYPAPNAAFFVCEASGDEPREGNGGSSADPIATSLEWGVRSLGKRVSVNAEGDLPAEAVADVFPAYDDDGGLLIVLTPEG